MKTTLFLTDNSSVDVEEKIEDVMELVADCLEYKTMFIRLTTYYNNEVYFNVNNIVMFIRYEEE